MQQLPFALPPPSGREHPSPQRPQGNHLVVVEQSVDHALLVAGGQDGLPCFQTLSLAGREFQFGQGHQAEVEGGEVVQTFERLGAQLLVCASARQAHADPFDPGIHRLFHAAFDERAHLAVDDKEGGQGRDQEHQGDADIDAQELSSHCFSPTRR